MGRVSGTEMVNRRLEACITRQKDTINDLKKQVTKLKQIIYEICDRHDITPPDLRYGHYVPAEHPTPTGTTVCEDASKQPEFTELLISEMARNQERTYRQDSLEMKQFWSLVFLRSPASYGYRS